MKARKRSHSKNAALLTSLAESIGSALGTIAAKANAAQKALGRDSAVRVVEREGKRLARRSKRAVRKTGKAAAAKSEAEQGCDGWPSRIASSKFVREASRAPPVDRISPGVMQKGSGADFRDVGRRCSPLRFVVYPAA